MDPREAYENIFNNGRSVIDNIPTQLIDEFETEYGKHPFRVKHDQEMDELINEIKEHGIFTPAIVRPAPGQPRRFQMLSGHRRLYAATQAGLSTIPCLIKDVDDAEATIIMTSANLKSRQNILPSEKAFAYKMQRDALARQGKRNDLTSDPLGRKLGGKETTEIIGEKNSDSQTQVKRYIRLTYLIPELLEMVDEGKLGFRPAVELSYLSEDNQEAVYEQINLNKVTPSLAQAQFFKQKQAEGKLTENSIEEIMDEPKANQKEFYHLPQETIDKYFKSQTATKESENNHKKVINAAVDQALSIYVELSKTENENIRLQLAADTRSPNLLKTLAGDKSPKVRAVVALNPACPVEVFDIFKNDSSSEVRKALSKNHILKQRREMEER